MDRIASPGSRPRSSSTCRKGYVDETGVLHRRGVMRLATAADEILPLRDPRVQQNQAYLAVIVLARVITRLGHVPDDRHRHRSKGCSPPISTICSGSTRRSTRPTSREGVAAPAARRTASGRGGGPARPGGSLRPIPWPSVRGDGLHRRTTFTGAARRCCHRARRAAALVPRDLGASTARSTARRRSVRGAVTRWRAPIPCRLPLPGRDRRGRSSGGFAR